MPASPVIDARPRGPRGPLAGEHVLGRPILAHLVDLARSCGEGPIRVHARLDEHSAFGAIVDEPSVVFRTGPPPEGASILRADRLYDPDRLRRVVRSGRDPESAVVWRLDRPGALEHAEAEVVRRRTYQPLGRFWALAPARALARALRPTRVRPNAVTIAAAVAMLSASGMVAWGGVGLAWHAATAAMLAAALVLDTADGHLARIQGTASEFGRWLDGVLDELADMALHAAIAWAAFARTGQVAWVGLGMLYAMGKYLFVVAQQTGEATGGGGAKRTPAASASASLVRLIGHADVRWHLWIVAAALGELRWLLVAYAAYFPVRTAALAARKAARHG